MNPQSARIAVTGLGGICGLGHDVPQIWNHARAGKSGISLTEQVNTENLSSKVSGEVKNFSLAAEVLSEKEQRRYDRFIHFGLHTAYQAVEQAQLSQEMERGFYDPQEIAVLSGVGLCGLPFIEENYQKFLEKGPRGISPFFIPGVISNILPGLISINHGFRGTNFVLASACASSAHAIALGVEEIRRGRHKVVVAGGAEASLTHLGIGGFCSLRALSKRNDDPATASRPFDQDRDGFVIAEGSATLILEDYEHAQKRGATILAEIVGVGYNSDAHHITAPQPDGVGTTNCMKQALQDGGLTPQDIDYINAHGTSTKLGDIAETKAIKNVFQEHAYQVAVSSTKSMTGHLLGAAGAIEALMCIQALQEQVVPPTINLEQPDPECDLNYTPNQAQERSMQYALSNSFGFGGTNCTLIFKSAAV